MYLRLNWYAILYLMTMKRSGFLSKYYCSIITRISFFDFCNSYIELVDIVVFDVSYFSVSIENMFVHKASALTVTGNSTETAVSDCEISCV